MHGNRVRLLTRHLEQAEGLSYRIEETVASAKLAESETNSLYEAIAELQVILLAMQRAVKREERMLPYR